MKKQFLLLALAVIPFVAACVADSAEVMVVRAQIAAFNRHDPDALAALLAPTVKWVSLDGDKFSVDGEGREAIRTWLVGYFKSLPGVRSEMNDVTQTGAFVSYRERASWTAKDGRPRAQQALAIYEVRDGLITRVWSFPSVREPVDSSATPLSAESKAGPPLRAQTRRKVSSPNRLLAWSLHWPFLLERSQ